MIQVVRLSYRYPEAPGPALSDISVEVGEGELLVVAGHSGTGKSTFARALCGLVPHFFGGEMAGRVLAFGRDTRSVPPRGLADVVGFVAQDPESSSVVDRVEDEVVFTMENLGVDPIVMRKRLEEVLDALGIAALRGRSLGTLSGGERQRVAIASVLAAQPRCLILDEPTSQLDPQSSEDVLGTLQRLNADLGLGVVLVEHRLERVVQYADRMLVLRDGASPLVGGPREVMRTSPVAPPVVILGRALGWDPLPLSVREGRALAAGLPVRPPGSNGGSAPGDTLIEARGLRVARGGREVLRGVDLAVRAGETLAVVGRNGAGKTTLLRALVGLLSPHAGRVAIAGLDPARTPVEDIARIAGYLPQSGDAILFAPSVRDEIAFTLSGRRAPGPVDEVLDEAGLADVADDDPRELSAGRRQWAAIAAATTAARVVLLDEPTRGMDYAAKERLAAQCRRWRRAGCATVVVTHDVELIAQCATRVALLAEGSIVLDGDVREVLGESALFSSQMNKVFGDRRILTVADALEATGAR